MVDLATGVGVLELDVVVGAGREAVAGVGSEAGPGVLKASVVAGVGKPEEGWGGGVQRRWGWVRRWPMCIRDRCWRQNGGGIGEGCWRR